MNIAICLLCVTPDHEQVLFYSNLSTSGFDVFVLADCNQYRGQLPANTRLLQVDDEQCTENGFHYFNPTIKHKRSCSAWDKALYWFSLKLQDYDYVWFVEEDVFVPQLSILVNLQNRYREHDLLLGRGRRLDTDEMLAKSQWVHWPKLPKQIKSPPYSMGMCCASRVSRKLLECTADFVADYNSNLPPDVASWEFSRLVSEHGVPFIEFILPTLADHNSLKTARPPELLDTVLAPRKLKQQIAAGQWDPHAMESYDPTLIYHPVKDLSLQTLIRRHLRTTSTSMLKTPP